MSDDGRHAFTIIAFVGSVFSPYYRYSGRARPENHCALNVALYGAGGKRWSMTERGAGDLIRDQSSLVIGPSALVWENGGLTIHIDETTSPLPRRLRGTIRLRPERITDHPLTLDGAGRHRWWPIAPRAHVEVRLSQPALAWTGTGYLDHNVGAEPLETGFRSWNWSRACLSDGTAILYDATRRDGSTTSLALHVAMDGTVTPRVAPPVTSLPRTHWRIARATRTDDGGPATLHAGLEDTPFYARALIGADVFGERVVAMHETLSLDRFALPIVQAMLPFRMPRWPRFSSARERRR